MLKKLYKIVGKKKLLQEAEKTRKPSNTWTLEGALDALDANEETGSTSASRNSSRVSQYPTA